MMKRKTSGIISLSKTLRNLDNEKYTFLIFFILTAGIIYGCMIYFNPVYKSNSFTLNLSGSGLFNLFSRFIIINGISLFAEFIFGLCIAGAPFITAVIFFRTTGAGFTGAYLYGGQGIEGLKYFASAICPGTAILLSALAMAGIESMHTLSEINRCCTHSDSKGKVNYYIYIKRYIVPFIAAIIASFVHAVCLTYIKPPM